MVRVGDRESHWRTGGASSQHAADNRRAVCLYGHPPAGAERYLASRQVRADQVLVQRQAGRQPLQYGGQLRTMRLSCCYQTDHFFFLSGATPCGRGVCLLRGLHGKT